MRTIAIAVPLLLFAAGFSGMGAAQEASILFFEDWEGGLQGWQGETNFTQDCDLGLPGCSLRVDAGCCGQGYTLRRDVDIMIPADGALTLSFGFLGESIQGDMDTGMKVNFSQTQEAIVTMTEFFGPNNGVSLHVTGAQSDLDFVDWNESDTWYQVRLTLDGGARTATLALHDNDGALLGASQALPLPEGVDRVRALEVWATRWGSGVPYRYDTLCVTDAVPPPVGCLPPLDTRPHVDLEGETVRGDLPLDATLRITAQPHSSEHALASWSLDLGDGQTLEGTGAPPETVTHTYTQYGGYTAKLRVVQDDGFVRADSAGVFIRTLQPVVTNVTHTPEEPQARPADDPWRWDNVTVSADITDPEGTDVRVYFCSWRPGLSACYHRDVVDGRFSGQTVRGCEGQTVEYRIVARDAHGDHTVIYGEFTYGGTPGLGDLGCLPIVQYVPIDRP